MSLTQTDTKNTPHFHSIICKWVKTISGKQPILCLCVRERNWKRHRNFQSVHMVSRILVDCTMSREWDLNYKFALLYKITTDGHADFGDSFKCRLKCCWDKWGESILRQTLSATCFINRITYQNVQSDVEPKFAKGHTRKPLRNLSGSSVVH